jgi:hypothetical protein
MEFVDCLAIAEAGNLKESCRETEDFAAGCGMEIRDLVKQHSIQFKK